ncbi:MAG: hypothetical protein KZQ60_14445 [Candidatus Thiodiazotropha sp. (ex Lucinoma aequizonata)]|nr:hypothetical protein [Candidatus Thiodiazotropha sp. (ex Lucinoma aequizonata)]MCU7898388.1 hypothetical protein [Candidatus Thiodiazotropha sp. (ex Lucinoma aequizonata)]
MERTLLLDGAPQTSLQSVVETASTNEAELSAYCRERELLSNLVFMRLNQAPT